MQGVAVTLLTEDKERLSALQHRLEGTQTGRIVFAHVGFPSSATDPSLRQIQDVRTEVVLVDIDPHNAQRAIHTIELIHSNTSDIAIFAVGGMHDPATIVAAMRAGAREYLERDASPASMIEALTRFSASRSKSRTTSGRARVFTFASAKGGAGATTAAVNTAIALQESHGGVLLVDFAPLGHASLHLNLRPAFGVMDALQNLHRLDSSLLEGLMTACKGGLQLLAGPQQPLTLQPNAADLARLFDLLVSHFRYVIVDASSRMDQTARLLCDLSNAVLLVAQADVVSLWSAARIRTFLEEGGGRDRVRLIINRYKKIPGFTDEDVEKATNCKLLWKLPNNFQSISPAIDKGSPVAWQSNDDISRSYRSLAETLADASASSEGSMDLSYNPDKAGSKKKAVGHLLISPLRAGQ
ncbi:MAG TPA: AAA family ATPase [Candidatus Angelobacter sp.]|jgi:pilus assembly protein CpaE|nr:AAA family ATPase [Candidatus Angelobacter sp.]